MIMDMPKDLYELYAEYGIAAEKAQVLETEAGNVAIAFVALLVGTNRIDDQQKKFYSNLVDDVNRKTMGSLLKDIKTIVDFDEEGIGVIDDALEKRNYLAHHFFRTHNFAIMVQDGRKKMLEELRQIQNKLDIAHASLSSISSLLQRLCGLDLPDLEKLIKAGKKVDI